MNFVIIKFNILIMIKIILAIIKKIFKNKLFI